MSKNVIQFISYKLVEGASVADFLLASEKCNNEVLSKHPGFISWKMLTEGDMWVDLVTWETMEDAINAQNNESFMHNPVALQFFSFINFESLKSQLFSVEKSY